mgnify:CR=1 FL=1|jgi:hypothetical protein
MHSWFKKEVGDGVAAYGPSMKVQEIFLGLAKAGVDVSKMAVFSEADHVNNTITLYFTPESTLLAKAFNAVPCEKPEASRDIGLLVGEADNWKHFS